MRSETLLRLFLLAVVLAFVAALGIFVFTSYWGDTRTVVGYALARDARSLDDAAQESVLEEALEVDSDNWLAHLQLGELLMFAGDDHGAAEHLGAALDVNQSSPRANYSMGVAQFRLGSVDAALPYFLEAARLDPGDLQYEGMVKQLRAIQEGKVRPGGSLDGPSMHDAMGILGGSSAAGGSSEDFAGTSTTGSSVR